VNDVFENMYISFWCAYEEIARDQRRSNNAAGRGQLHAPVGNKGTFTLHVQPEHLANRFKDAILPQVLATPVMILIMENAALNAMRPFLDAGESAVGTAVDVRHFASTPVGRDVRATAEVVNVNLLLASEPLTAFSLSPEIKVI
jgi:predicted thioesterase